MRANDDFLGSITRVVAAVLRLWNVLGALWWIGWSIPMTYTALNSKDGFWPMILFPLVEIPLAIARVQMTRKRLTAQS